MYFYWTSGEHNVVQVYMCATGTEGREKEYRGRGARKQEKDAGRGGEVGETCYSFMLILFECGLKLYRCCVCVWLSD